MTADQPFEVADPSGLTDADWAEINKLRRIHERGGQRAFSKALKKLSDDPIRYMSVVEALFPNRAREAIRDAMAELGMTDGDLHEFLRKLQSPVRKQ